MWDRLLWYTEFSSVSWFVAKYNKTDHRSPKLVFKAKACPVYIRCELELYHNSRLQTDCIHYALYTNLYSMLGFFLQ